MAQSRVITHDEETRLSVKARLAAKLEQVTAPVVEKLTESETLLIPSNHEKLSEGELLFTLTNNTELQHSQDSALRTLGILKGKFPFPKNLILKSVELENPVKLPEFAIEAPIQRKASTTAPGFKRAEVKDDYRIEAENLKKEEFKQALAHKLEEALIPKIEKAPRVVRPLVQINSAPPEFVERVKRPAPIKPTKVYAREVENAETDYRVPANYTELTEYELGHILTRESQFEHTPESANFVLDVLFGRREPTEIPKKIIRRIEPTEHAIIEDDATVLLLPANYRDFSDVDLHQVLQNTPELGHNEESAMRTMRILRGWEKPIKFVLKTSEFVSETHHAEVVIKRNIKEQLTATCVECSASLRSAVGVEELMCPACNEEAFVPAPTKTNNGRWVYVKDEKE